MWCLLLLQKEGCFAPLSFAHDFTLPSSSPSPLAKQPFFSLLSYILLKEKEAANIHTYIYIYTHTPYLIYQYFISVCSVLFCFPRLHGKKKKTFDEAVMILRSASLSFWASGHFGMTRPVSWRGSPEFAAMAARAFRFVTLRSRSEPPHLSYSQIGVMGCLFWEKRVGHWYDSDPYLGGAITVHL